VDMDGFFAAVESIYHPEADGKPMAVAGDPKNRRGIILAKNQLAKKAGVKTAEPIWQAMRKCPDLLLLPPRHHLYEEYCEKANEIYERYTDLVQRASIDESYLDITGAPKLRKYGAGAMVADEIRDVIRSELRLTASVGVSFCKLFAKMGSELNKQDGTSVISRENYKSILYPLPVRAIMSVGGATEKTLASMGIATEKTLASMGIATVGQLAAVNEELLVKRPGKHGSLLYRYANGLDTEPVRRSEEQDEMKSIGNGMTFRRDLLTMEDIRLGILKLSDTVAYRLRKHNKKCYGIQVTIKDPELKVIDRQSKLEKPTNLAKTISETALAIVERTWKIGKPIRLLTVTAINLTSENDGGQMSLFDDPSAEIKQEKLERLIDGLKSQYGESAVKHASVLKNDLGIED